MDERIQVPKPKRKLCKLPMVHILRVIRRDDFRQQTLGYLYKVLHPPGASIESDHL